MRRFVYFLVFLMLVNEGTSTNIYARFMFAPFKWVAPVLFEPVAKTIRPFDMIMIAILIWGRMKKSKSKPLPPMRKALLTGLFVTIGWFVYGAVRGGDVRAASWQCYLLFSTILCSFAFATIFTTAEHFIGLFYTVVVAGLYHALMCVLFYIGWVSNRSVDIGALGDYLTVHDDTVLWTIGVCFLFMRAFLFPTGKNKIWAALLIPFLMTAIQLNHRRLAWISLGGSLVSVYFLLPAGGKVKRRINRIVMVVVPIIVLYAAIGWGRPEGIFRPLRAFESVSSAQDNSTKARNVENLGLIATANQGWVTGTGWGHKYIEISSKYQIYFFELWPYIPHNSVLGLFAYTGALGFLGYWLMLPTAGFFHARTARHGPHVAERFVGIIGMVELVACADQWYGDMGMFSPITNYTLATCFAAALRVPVIAQVWSDGKPKPLPGKQEATETPESSGEPERPEVQATKIG